jgi:cytochrome c oxidase subunit 4
MAGKTLHGPVLYFGIFGALLLLTLTTVVLSGLELGGLEVPLALGIASTKAVLVALFFMHLLESPRLTWVIVGAALLFVAILAALTMADYWTRNQIPTRPAPGQQVVGEK